MAITPDDRLAFATMTGYGYITSWRLDSASIPYNSPHGLTGF